MELKVHYKPDEYNQFMAERVLSDFPTGIEESYREKGWGMWEAIREFGQNALDATETLEIYQSANLGGRGLQKGGTVISDKGAGLQVRNFVFGASQKQKWERGQFGEGMKLAMLSCLRAGYPVSIVSVGLEVYAMLVWDRIVEMNLFHLAYKMGPGIGMASGTEVTIHGYFGESYRDNFRQFIGPAAYSVPSTVTQPVQRYLGLFRNPPGRLYLRDIYLRDIDSDFSYNLWEFEPAPDRHGPADASDIHVDLGRLWSNCLDTGLVTAFLQSSKDRRYESEARLDLYSLDDEAIERAKPVWKYALRSVYGPRVTIDTHYGKYNAELAYYDYTPISLPWKQESFIAAMTEDSLATVLKFKLDAAKDSEEVPDGRLDSQQLLHLQLLRWINVQLNANVQASKISGAIMPGAEGLCHRSNRTILISIGRLDKFQDSLNVLCHELTHLVTSDDHGTEHFINGTTNTAARIMRVLSTSVLPDDWSYVKW